MQSRRLRTFVVFVMASAFASSVLPMLRAQDKPQAYPSMFPLEQYLIADRAAEVALARSAAPDSISKDAKVLVLTKHGYEAAVEGKNGFVCLVERAWESPIDSPDFWNPKLRGPVCLNAAAARSYGPLSLRKTDLVLAGKSKAVMFAAISSALDKKELPLMEPGAMSYMMSRQQYLGDEAAHWHPHLMFFVPLTAGTAWGAGLPGSPIFAGEDKEDRLTIFLVPLATWSDGTPAPMDAHEH